MRFQFQIHRGGGGGRSEGGGRGVIEEPTVGAQRSGSLLGGTHVAVLAAEVVHHHAVGVPGERTEGQKRGHKGH